MRTKVLLDGIWHFHADPDDIGLPQKWFLEENFQYLEDLHLGFVPGCWNAYNNELALFTGVGWYFTNFEIPRELSHQKIFLYFEGVFGDGNDGVDVFLDGKKILTHKGASSPFTFELTSLQHEIPHFLVIRIDSKQGGGLNRSVYLEYSDWIIIDDHYFLQKIEWTPQNTAKSVELTIKSFLRNDTNQEWTGKIEYTIAYQKAVFSTKTREFNIQNKNSRLLTTVLILDAPHLWNINNPYLYEVEARVIESNGHLVDEKFKKIGIREIHSRDEKLILNHQEVSMSGVRVNFSSNQFGSAMPSIYLIQKLYELKTQGINLLSFDQLPNQSILDLTDKLGFCVIESADKFDVIDSHAESLIKTMIYRDRDHPSVVSWKYTRELDPSRAINSELVTKWINSFEERSL